MEFVKGSGATAYYQSEILFQTVPYLLTAAPHHLSFVREIGVRSETPVNGKDGGEKDEEEEGTRDNIVGLFPKTVDMDELSWFPTMGGVYWDKNKDKMAIDGENWKVVIDGTATVRDVQERQRDVEERRMAEKEKQGHLTRRCLKGLKEDGKVERKVFRNLCKALEG